MTWWLDYKTNFIKSMSFFDGIVKRCKSDETISQFFSDYEKTVLTEFIFESNTIEGEGLSEGATKKLVFDKFGQFEDIRKGLGSQITIEDFTIFPKTDESLTIAVSYNHHNKDIFLVYNQLNAVLFTEKIRLQLENLELETYIKLVEIKKQIQNSSPGFDKSELEAERAKLIKQLSEMSFIINEEILKKIHSLLSVNFNNNDNGLPGEFRPEGAFIDFKTFFLEPTLIPHAINKMINQHKMRYNRKKFYNPILEACRISADIVRIHPFGDFNGRTSRLVLNLILRKGKFPFYLILKSNSKAKKKYIKAMKDYVHQGKLSTYISLVCMTFLQQVDSVNQKLIYAGIPPIEPVQLTENRTEELLQSLEEYLS